MIILYDLILFIETGRSDVVPLSSSMYFMLVPALVPLLLVLVLLL